MPRDHTLSDHLVHTGAKLQGHRKRTGVGDMTRGPAELPRDDVYQQLI